jgi:hypothetical protein
VSVTKPEQAWHQGSDIGKSRYVQSTAPTKRALTRLVLARHDTLQAGPSCPITGSSECAKRACLEHEFKNVVRCLLAERKHVRAQMSPIPRDGRVLAVGRSIQSGLGSRVDGEHYTPLNPPSLDICDRMFDFCKRPRVPHHGGTAG